MLLIVTAITQTIAAKYTAQFFFILSITSLERSSLSIIPLISIGNF